MRVKICGLTRPQDAERAVELGAAWLGLNFWPRSPRAVNLDQARAIRSAVGPRVPLVGVFVDQEPAFVRQVQDEVGLDLVQLHGDEPARRVAELPGKVLKVFRVGEAFDSAQLAVYPEAWGFLFDVRHPDYGGTGVPWAWERVRDLPTAKPVLVAGGVRPGRVREVIRRSRPYGLDVCSGVESEPGIKDGELMRRLFEEAMDEQQVRLA